MLLEWYIKREAWESLCNMQVCVYLSALMIKNTQLLQERCLRIWLNVDSLPLPCFKYITWKIINHWFPEKSTLAWTTLHRASCIAIVYLSHLFLFFFWTYFLHWKETDTGCLWNETSFFSPDVLQLNIRKPLDFTELDFSSFLMETPMVCRAPINGLGIMLLKVVLYFIPGLFPSKCPFIFSFQHKMLSY